MFEDEITELQADMIDICNEYSCGVAEKIFIIASCEREVNSDCFYVINDKIFERHKINTSESKANFDVSAACQKQMLNILKEDVKKIKSVCDKYEQPMFTEMRLVYEPKTKKFNTKYKYEPQLTDGKEMSDIVNEWFEEEKSEIGGRSWGFVLAVIVLILLGLIMLVCKAIKTLVRRIKRRLRKEKKTFEEELSALQTDMVDICNEYSQGFANKIFIYVTYENELLYAMHFYSINNKLLKPAKLNESELDVVFVVTEDYQKQVLDILNEDVKKIKSLCEKYSRPMFTEMRLVYEPKTKKFDAEYKYDPQFTDDMALSDILSAWFEEENAKLRSGMKYYEIGRGGEGTKYPEPKLFGEWAEERLYANEWRNRNLALPVTMSVKNRYSPGNYPLADSALVSYKFLGVIKKLNSDYEALPTQMYYKEKEPIWGIYYSMTFPEYEVLNLEKSEYDTGPYGDDVCMIDKIVLSKEKLSHVYAENNIFALKESSVIILCTETAKNMIEAAGIKDVSFTEVPVE